MSRSPANLRSIYARIRNLEKAVGRIPVGPQGGVPITSWEPLTIGGGWGVYSGDVFSPPAYFKDFYGFVHLRGLISGGGPGAIIETMEEGYLPAYRIVMSTICYGPGTARIDVLPTGELIIVNFTDNRYVALDGVRWRAES